MPEPREAGARPPVFIVAARLAGRRHAVLAMASIAVVILSAFAPAWARGQVFYELDTLKLYAPFIEYAASSLRAGTLPLWNPYILTGFPQFAEGQAGVLHPLHLPFLLAGAYEALMVWGPVLRALLAAASAYAFARALRISASGAAMSALSFGLGSFVIAHQHHLNIANTAPVLPAVLAAFEWGLRTPKARRRLAWFGIAGLIFSTALLAIQPQLVLITAFGVVLYVTAALVFRCWSDGSGHRAWARTVGWAIAGGLVVALIGTGLSAIQTVPLMELISNSARGTALPAAEAARFALPPLGAVQLLFPSIFGRGDGYWFSWNQWETAFYAGAVPLVFALLALRRPSRRVVALAVVAIVSVLIAQGVQGPLPLFELVNSIPGFDRARAPGRFVLIALVMLATLAGFGLDAVRRQRFGRLAAALGATVAGCVLALSAIHAWLRSGDTAIGAATEWVASQPELNLLADTDVRVDLMVESTEPWRTANVLPPLAALVILGVVIAAGRHVRLRSFMVPIALSLTAAELAFFAATFHPAAPVGQLLKAPDLEEAAGPGGTYPRVYVAEAIMDGSNRLLPARRAEATGYTPLASTRLTLLLEAWTANPPRIARVLGVERAIYLSDPTQGFERWIVKGPDVTFSLNRPAFAVDLWSPETDGVIDIPADMYAREVIFVASLDGGTDDAQGEPVATLAWLRGQTILAEKSLRAGFELSERTGFGILRIREPAHGIGEVAAVAGYSSVYTLIRASYRGPQNPDHLRVRVHRAGRRITIHGISLIDRAGNLHRIWAPLIERLDALEGLLTQRFEPGPRAFLNDRVQLVDSVREALERLTQSDHQYPRRSVIEAGPWGPSLDQSFSDELDGSNTSDASAEIIVEVPTRLVITSRAPRPMMLIVRDGYYPGWKATVDDVEAPLLAADVASRAVPVPAGVHRIEMRYEPASLKVGAAISGAAMLATVGYFGLLAGWPRITRLSRYRSTLPDRRVRR